ncbi:MAG: hypothetical protein GTO53_05380 [Planctomycetales bacterium]|nr:hypothetical protein [Planctomycetales bacterium]NIM08581.1 hypothetical protein [Planctomycetales bacterium]NIN08050.1 hypothetical protein [Planctomycetales bacterium]NIN77186.1 hypothetical protein [Planctomycetales bacterium]NIO34368.1 hypothetical protein [Planctomycetales bacterium]
MSTADLTNQIMALPPTERAAIAQRLWESIEDELVAITPESDAEAITDARRRDEELSRGDVSERSHADVMENARRSIGCE